MATEIASLRSEWCKKFEAVLKANNARFDESDARHERSEAELFGRGSKGRARPASCLASGPPTGPASSHH